MKKILVKKCLAVVCLLTTSLYTNLLFADWPGNKSYRNYNPGYGDFPPEDIDQQLLAQQEKINKAADAISSREDNASTISGSNNISNKSSSAATPNPVRQHSEQNIQQPAYGSYDRYRKYAMQRRQNHINRRNRHTGFSGPWNNRGSSFSTPWNNNGSGFSSPWGNNGSGFTPLGNDNGNGWSW